MLSRISDFPRIRNMLWSGVLFDTGKVSNVFLCRYIIVSHTLGVSYTSFPWLSVCEYRPMRPNHFSFCYLWHGGLTPGCKRRGLATVGYGLVNL